MLRRSWSLRSSIAILLLALSAWSARAQESTTLTVVRVSDEIDLDPVGNAFGRSEIVLPPEIYTKLKGLVSPRYTVQENGKPVVKFRAPKVESVLRYLGITSTAYELHDVKGEFDDDAATINVEYKILGRARYRQGHWVFALISDPEMKIEVRKSAVTGETAELEFRNKQQNLTFITRLELNLPKGASKIEFRNKSLELVYGAPAPTDTDKLTNTRPEMRLETKPQLMSALYKLYGNPKWLEMWSARCVFQNETPETLTDYRARFRIEGYSSWTPWVRCDKVFPGQTVVDSFYPVIDSKVAQLKGSTPVLVELEYEYTRPKGEKVTESESARMKMLGMNEALWSNLEADGNSSWYEFFRNGPMVLSSFTSATDPVILDVVGLVGKAIGGRGPSLSDENALLFMGTLYNLLRQNIVYETTPGGEQNGIVHQHLKYGRDVLRSKSGTCVNLSILYASVCEAAGLHAYIILGQGHAFAAAKLPQSGLPVFVETTGCGGGTKESSMTFVQARESAYKTYQQWSAQGLLIETDIAGARKEGVPSPELPEAGSNPLKEWGIQQPEMVDQVYLPKLMVSVKAALDGAEMPYSPMQGVSAVNINFKTREGNEWSTIIQTVEDQEIVVMMSRVPGLVPENQRPTIATFLAESNTNLLHGNYEISKEGAVTFRTSANVKGGMLSSQMLLNDLNVHFNLMQKQLPELRKFVTDGAGQQQASNQNQQNTGNGNTSGQTPQPQPAVPANYPLIGRWKTILKDQYGHQFARGVLVRADGTFVVIEANSNGGTTEIKGRWSVQDGELTVVTDSQQTYSGAIKIVNRNRWIFHDNALNMDIVYDRLPET